jgi:hypothetical protein
LHLVKNLCEENWNGCSVAGPYANHSLLWNCHRNPHRLLRFFSMLLCLGGIWEAFFHFFTHRRQCTSVVSWFVADETFLVYDLSTL